MVMAGHDPGDPTSADLPVPDYRSGLETGVAGLRIGVPRAFFAAHPALTPEARDAIGRTLDWLREGGAQVEDVALPDYEVFFACGRLLMTAEMHALHHGDLRARPQDYAEATLKRFVLGAAISSADYIDAQRLRRSLTDAVHAVLDQFDALLTAVSLTPPPPFSTAAPPSTWPTQANMFNVTGHPAMTVPVGTRRHRLPARGATRRTPLRREFGSAGGAIPGAPEWMARGAAARADRAPAAPNHSPEPTATGAIVTEASFHPNWQAQPYWWDAAPPQPANDQLPSEVDVAIVGSGYSGLHAAREFARNGLSVAVLEAGEPGFRGEHAQSWNGQRRPEDPAGARPAARP